MYTAIVNVYDVFLIPHKKYNREERVIKKKKKKRKLVGNHDFEIIFKKKQKNTKVLQNPVSFFLNYIPFLNNLIGLFMDESSFFIFLHDVMVEEIIVKHLITMFCLSTTVILDARLTIRLSRRSDE